MGLSHGPMLSTPPEQWEQRANADRSNNQLHFRGATYSFEELVALRSEDRPHKRYELAERVRRYEQCRAAIEALRKVWEDVAPDVAVIVGDDQDELLSSVNMPAFLLYGGASIDHRAPGPEFVKKLGPGLATA